ncbi:hypothetical protein BP5796_06324 [Coleophoma crateriformis]|uniref:Uncharacterized protein n=1 Tax=Coleophoma crateriformis TaxID=565419 RepID=A0A3D8RWL4_9HELO|nr:hypothetical protein BP5796_06324 [Coleophoma crateriformis]
MPPLAEDHAGATIQPRRESQDAAARLTAGCHSTPIVLRSTQLTELNIPNIGGLHAPPIASVPSQVPARFAPELPVHVATAILAYRREKPAYYLPICRCDPLFDANHQYLFHATRPAHVAKSERYAGDPTKLVVTLQAGTLPPQHCPFDSAVKRKEAMSLFAFDIEMEHVPDSTAQTHLF